MSDNPDGRPMRAGLWLFFIYVLFYAGFVLLSAFFPGVMAKQVLGVNLAIGYGFGLIGLAFVLALLYMVLTSGRGTEGEGRP